MIIVVFDFDWSLINENSDTFVIRELSRDGRAWNALNDNPDDLPWTALMDSCLGKLKEEGDAGKRAIADCIARIPVFPEMLEAIRTLGSKDDVRMHIVSDANEYYIDSFMEHHGIEHLFASVHTNPSRWEQERLRVSPFHPADAPPHNCPHCPENMCKRIILNERVLGERSSSLPNCDNQPIVVYIGDGGGDYCPIMSLEKFDYALVRDDPDAPRARGLIKRITALGGPAQVPANVKTWRNGHDAKALLQSIYDMVK